MREVQNPTGSYPAYLVISELSRRKRMRESAAKQPPTTTVAEDLAQPTVPPAAPMNRLNAGLGAAPAAAESLAAQDVMAQQEVPVGMAGGGVVHAYNGLPESSYEFGSYTLPEEIEAYRPLFPSIGAGNVDYKLKQLGYEREQIQSMDPAVKRFITERSQVQPSAAPFKAAAPAAPGTPAAAATTTTAETPAAPKPAPYRDPYAGLAEQSLSGFLSLKAPTEQELATSRAAGRTQYEQEVPYRLGFLEEEIAKRGRDVAGRRESNINEALIQAGLGIMGSKSPRFLQAVSEGGLSGLNAYRQGVKDIRAAEDALLTARTESAKAQMLYDQGKMGAGEKAEQRGLDAFKRSQELANTQNAAIVRTQEAMQKGPYMAAMTEQALANAEYLRSGKGRGGISDADQKAADEFAKSQLITKGILPGNPKYMDEYKRQFDAYLTQIRGGQPGMGGSTAPAARDRGTL